MSDDKGGETINQGGAPEPTKDARDRAYDMTGNAGEKGERPSPGERERGEISTADPAPAVDLDSAHDRAS